ncbi:uncharacterized protein Z520_00033 [Fonsecaea multimorphosa CBS 102226]|uniref:protein-histidine N-methyltransferase n=1 Tax=Fonsecaea multimorphosa CBS 102226 TaxID=1442371 RepID=A0A0D2J1U1_9EURO|nr:uncharacterized protein Z520_00033 [Fonsecaea multimorphosa CBS 102226]KIY03342.1 hypothetical protein Z520_00033 [Fonsecaea multimorphosa CBS 102226]OAL32993.1 hypothetical protein AYO22_00078 [Fonsecaea multimorphosa]
MSFSFGFSGDDIEGEGDATEHEALTSQISQYTLSDSVKSPAHIAVQPERHSLGELLASLPSQISYSKLHIPSPEDHGLTNNQSNNNNNNNGVQTTLYRRSVFDIRAQLMAEANPSAAEEEDTAKTLLSGLESGDLASGVYEGGFKTWECALDLASLVASESDFVLHHRNHPGQEEEDWEVVELGAGSAVPTLALITKFLERRKGQSPQSGSLKVTLCDYNVDVLRLATAPNVLLNYLFASAKVSPSLDDEGSWDGGDLDLEELGGDSFVNSTLQDIASKNISFDFISGGWGPEFLDLINRPPSPSARDSQETDQNRRPPTNLLILASETIYSPSSLKSFSETVLSLLLRTSSHSHRSGTGTGKGEAIPEPKAWVAAKRVYFGVGGGVDEFVREMDRLGATSRVVMDIKDAGVGRVVLEVTLSAPASEDITAST